MRAATARSGASSSSPFSGSPSAASTCSSSWSRASTRGCCAPVADWTPTIAVLLAGVLYGVAVARARRVDGRLSARPGAVAAFAGGLVTTGVALAPPFHEAAEKTFSAHMIQHVLLIAVAAPLLVIGDPVRTMLLGAPDRWRRRLRSVHRARAGEHWVVWISVA